MKPETKNVIYWSDKELRAAMIEGEDHSIREQISITAISTDEIVKELKAFLRQTHSRARAWIVVIRSSDVLWKNLTVPSQNEEEIARMVTLSLKPLVWQEGMVFDHRVIHQTVDGHAHLLIGIVHDELIGRIYRTLKDAGVRIAGWTTTSQALRSWIDENDAIILNLFRDYGELSCFCGGQIDLIKMLPLNGDRMTGALPLALDFISSCRARHEGCSFSMFVFTKEEDTAWLSSVPLAAVIDQEEQRTQEWRVGQGACLVPDKELMQWIPLDIQEKKLEELWRRQWGLCAGLVILIMLTIAALAGVQYYAKTERLQQLKSQLGHARLELERLEAKSKRLEDIRSRLASRIFLTDIAALVDSSREEGLYLNRMELTGRNEVLLHGIAVDDNQLSALQSKLIAARMFSDVSLMSAQRKGNAQEGLFFKVRCIINKGKIQ